MGESENKMTTLTQLLERRADLIGFGDENKIEDVETVIERAVFLYQIAYSNCSEGKPTLLLTHNALEYALGQAEMYIQKQIIVKDYAGQDDDWQYIFPGETITVPGNILEMKGNGKD